MTIQFLRYYRGDFLIEKGEFSNWMNYVERHPILQSALKVMGKLDSTSSDARSYIVGGAVRDVIMGRDFDDIDIATNVSMSDIEKLFPNQHDIGKNKEFGIAVVVVDGHEFEIAQFRSDGTYSDGRRPDSVKIVQSFKDDAARRDLTINAMAIDKEGNIIDYFDGKKDIQNQIVKTVGDPEERFSEDYIRMLRAVRFASRLGFDIDVDTIKAIKSNKEKIREIAVERVMKEILKMAKEKGPKFARSIEMLVDVELLAHIFPEIYGMKNFGHDEQHHPEGGVLDHTLAALRKYDGNDPVVNMSILFHDVGKTETWEQGDTYHGHDTEGAKIIDKVADRMKMTNKMRDAMKFCAEKHMLIHNLLELKNSTVFRLMESEFWPVLLKVAEADAKARGEAFDPDAWEKKMQKAKRMEDKYALGKEKEKIKKVVNGNTVMQIKGIDPGPEVGRIIDKTIEWILNNDIDLDEIDRIHEYIKSL